MLGSPGEEARRAAVPEGDPQGLEVTPAITAEHGRDAAARIDFEEQMPAGRLPIGPVERQGSVGQDAPDGLAVSPDQVTRRHCGNGRRSREGHAERVPVALIQPLGQGIVQACGRRSRVDVHDQGLGAVEFVPRVIDFGGAA
jgi:hypothetical protein